MTVISKENREINAEKKGNAEKIMESGIMKVWGKWCFQTEKIKERTNFICKYDAHVEIF